MRRCTLVWIDAREAVIVHWHDDRADLERLASDVPPHHRSTGHVRHDPTVRHGGGGAAQSDEPRRLEHLARFVDDVAGRLPPGDSLLLLGPGTVRCHLERLVRDMDERDERVRAITSEASPRRTDRQLAERLREHIGLEARRRTFGAYRWSGLRTDHPSDPVRIVPRRVVEKPPRPLGRGLW